MNLAGARVLVVGGARHLGRALALDLAQAGAGVAVTSRDTAQAAAAVSAIESLGRRGVAVTGDVATPPGARALVTGAADALGGLDAVVFAASGPFRPQAPEEIADDTFRASFAVVTDGFFAVAVAAYRRFVAQAEAAAGGGEAGRPGDAGQGDDSAGRTAGVVVALTDALGARPSAAFAAHGAAKAAQIMLVRELAKAWGPAGVRVCGVSPGPIDLPDDPRREASLRAAQRGPSRRLVAPHEVALAVRLCIEDDALTGIDLPVDAGFRLR